MSSEAAEFSSEAKELRYEATELSSEATEFSPGRFARQFVWFCESKESLHVPKVYVFQRKSMARVPIVYSSVSIAFTWRGCLLLYTRESILYTRECTAYTRVSIAYSSRSIAFT